MDQGLKIVFWGYYSAKFGSLCLQLNNAKNIWSWCFAKTKKLFAHTDHYRAMYMMMNMHKFEVSHINIIWETQLSFNDLEYWSNSNLELMLFSPDAFPDFNFLIAWQMSCSVMGLSISRMNLPHCTSSFACAWIWSLVFHLLGPE